MKKDATLLVFRFENPLKELQEKRSLEILKNMRISKEVRDDKKGQKQRILHFLPIPIQSLECTVFYQKPSPLLFFIS